MFTEAIAAMSFVLPTPHQSFDLAMDDGVPIRIRQHGNPGGVRLFVSHGNGFAVDGYLPFWGPLQDRFELIIFDFRNHGQNAPSPGDRHNYLQFTHDLETIYQGVTERLGAKTSVGVFHSMSGRTAMKHAVEIGWRWDALVLFDPPNLPLEGHWLYEAMRAFEHRLIDWALNRTPRFKEPAELARDYSGNRAHSRWVEGAHALMAEAVLRKDEEVGDWALACQRELEAAIYLEALTLNLWPRYEDYGGPVLTIGADPDMKGNPPTARANKALHDEHGYPYEAIPETGHMLQIEKPEACIQAMTRFLEANGIGG
ncbi:MAG TPA: alpha/beta hydrolase [Alphaproteobacteria bacterium]|nr:alpha/beta hydrolase [Alphaproteobacteria bacterium]